ncbi:MAG: DUF177 domain-containing protein [Cyanobacteria bacterium SID2]|nr:DUF177 domain-containing protein [Cyanobacteria bacterium SID2]MBP0003460.1 DUF177 domain-containing protein [Cyanobacteria bacterium SBC]
MDAIHIPSLLKAPESTETLQFREFIPGLETLMPVRGAIEVAHRGTYLEVSASVETILTLTCDRCLQQYNYRLKIQPQELIWLDERADRPDDFPIEQEVSMEELVEMLPPQGDFDPQGWIYEQLCLALPAQKHCREDCQGISPAESSPPIADSRWAALQQLKGQLPS